MNAHASEMPAGFAEHVSAWLRDKRRDFAKLIRVEGDGSDWNGSTEGGFYSTFGVEIVYESTTGRTVYDDIRGEEMASLWQHVVGGWDVAVQAGREAAARDIESTVVAGQKVPEWAFPGGTPTAEGLRTWAAAIARGDA